MPRLGALLICERLLLDQQNKPTLISLFQSISVLVADGQPAPPDIVAAVSWTIFSEWFFTAEELTGSYDQVLEVINPNGTPSAIRGRVTIKELVKDDQATRVYVNLVGMPMGQTGFIRVNIWLESDEKPMTEKFYYLIKAEHSKTQVGGQPTMGFSQQPPSLQP